MTEQMMLSLPALQGQPYIFEITVSTRYQLTLKPGWNMVSVPGSFPDNQFFSPNALTDQSSTAMLPMFLWNPSGFSYQYVNQIQQGEGYWLLSLAEAEETLSVSLAPIKNYTISLKQGWNMIGSVSAPCDFSYPQVEPYGSIANDSLFEWKTNGSSYQKSSIIKPGKGYWVLCWNDCQLTVDAQSQPVASPQRVMEPTSLIVLKIISDQQEQKLEIGWDDNPNGMDHPLPPLSPLEGMLEAYLVGEKYRWSRQIQLTSESRKEWQLQLKASQPTVLKVESDQGLEGQELVIRDGEEELLLSVGTEIQLPAGERQLSVALQSIKPEVTALLQNYPNPFNPETWIPFDLSEDAEVTIDIYDGVGDLVRRLSMGQISAGAYRDRERAAYWDGKNENGEQIASGVYFYQIRASNYREMRKMVILK